ncbi:hypothetical protein EK417_03445 [Chryseobacterium candidae]|uniref:RHS repeat-associated core domain-containing protein n=2 Tax=Chryseobacterium candidae TaxID=1978493 RepID=A0ABY2RBF7_9FLAO|nr:hypothetical protein EK417_03445 [Chryseobacterium candidae]
MYSYGWREYMPDIGRWNGIGQLAESYLSASPYAYVLNNPINMFDPDGRKNEAWLSEAPLWLQEMWNATPDGTNSYWFNNGSGFTSYQGGSSGSGGSGLAYSSTVSYGGTFTMGDWTYAMPPIVLTGNKSGWAAQFKNHMDRYASNVPEIRQSYYNFHPYQPDNTPEWYSTGGRGNWGLGVIGTAVEKLSGETRVTSVGSTIKLYRPNANGNVFIKNAYTKTIGLKGVGEMVGKGSFWLGVAMDARGVFNYYYNPESTNKVHPAKAGLNTAIGAYGTWINPAAGILYFGVDAFYPGGWEGYGNDYQSIQSDNAAIMPGFITAPYGSQKF